MVSPDIVDIGSEYFVVYLLCVYVYIYIYVCSAGYAELPVVYTSMFGVSHSVQKDKKLCRFTQTDR